MNDFTYRYRVKFIGILNKISARTDLFDKGVVVKVIIRMKRMAKRTFKKISLCHYYYVLCTCTVKFASCISGFEPRHVCDNVESLRWFV